MIVRITSLVLLLTLASNVRAQEENFHPLPYAHHEPAFDVAPQFPGGSSAMMQYLADSIRYPEPEWSQRKQGSVLVKFNVSRKGAISDIHIVNGVAGAPNFVKETMRVLEAMPRWTPATKRGKKVTAEVQVSVPFKLNDRRRSNK